MTGPNIVKRINALLKIRKIKKNDFYKACGITSAAFSQWNVGKTFPTQNNLKSISNYLGVSVEYILTGSTQARSLYDDPSPSGDDRSFQDGVPQSVLAELNAREQEDIKKDADLEARARKELFMELLDELSDEDLDKVIKIMLIMLNKEQ